MWRWWLVLSFLQGLEVGAPMMDDDPVWTWGNTSKTAHKPVKVQIFSFDGLLLISKTLYTTLDSAYYYILVIVFQPPKYPGPHEGSHGFPCNHMPSPGNGSRNSLNHHLLWKDCANPKKILETKDVQTSKNDHTVQEKLRLALKSVSPTFPSNGPRTSQTNDEAEF